MLEMSSYSWHFYFTSSIYKTVFVKLLWFLILKKTFERNDFEKTGLLLTNNLFFGKNGVSFGQKRGFKKTV